MSPPLKVGDKVRTATALKASHWSQNMMACRQPGAEGTIVRVAPPPDLYVGCSECRDQGRYIVRHDNPSIHAHYHGDELTLVTQGDPEPVDHSAAVDAADSWLCRELAGALRVPVTDGNELLHRLRARLEAYRALHGAVHLNPMRQHDAHLRVLDELGVSLDNPPAPVHDDSSLDPPRPVAHCERCGGRPEQHPGEPTCAELLQLWRRLSGREAYDLTNTGVLAHAALKARKMVGQLTRETEARSDELGKNARLINRLRERVDELSGIHQQLLEAVDGEPEGTTEELLGRVLRRAEIVQRLIETLEPEQLRGVAAGLHGFCSEGHSPGWLVADALDSVAAISEEEQ